MSDILKKLGEKPPHLKREERERLVAAVDEVYKPMAPPSLTGLDNIDLRVPDPFQSPNTDVEEFPVLTFDASSGLADLTELSMEKAKEILSITTEEKDDSFLSILRAQVSLITTVFTTQARVDESRLRARQADSLPKLLEQLRQEKAKLPGSTTLIEGAVSPPPPIVH